MIPRATAITRYRPLRSPDGIGGFTEALGAPLTIYGAWHVHEAKITVTFDSSEDVIVEDILQADDGAQYRVREIQFTPGSRWMKARLDRMARPIHP